jgi:hypothetical protein
MLKSLGELLTPEKRGGLVFPKPHLPHAEHYEAQEPQLPENRRPCSSNSAFALLRANCTGTSLNQQNKAKRALYLHTRATGANIYEWYNSFKSPTKQLRLSGAAIPANDSAEHKTFLHEVFCPQLFQHEVNTLHNRGFEDIKDNDFKTSTLQTEPGENAEVYGKFSADKRVRTFLASSRGPKFITSPVKGTPVPTTPAASLNAKRILSLATFR